MGGFIMHNERYEKGLKKMMEFNESTTDRGNHLKVVEDLKDIAPDISRFIIEFGYGDLYTREPLDNKQRALITIASLVTQGAEPQLEIHINAGLVAGLTPQEIVESITHLISYTGFPRVLNAIRVAKKVFEERGLMPVVQEYASINK